MTEEEVIVSERDAKEWLIHPTFPRPFTHVSRTGAGKTLIYPFEYWQICRAESASAMDIKQGAKP